MRRFLLMSCLVAFSVFPVCAFGQDSQADPDNFSNDVYAKYENFFQLPADTIKSPLPDGMAVGRWFKEVQCELAKSPEVEQSDQRRFEIGCQAAAAGEGTACTNWGVRACLCWTEEACDQIASQFTCGFCTDEEGGYCYGYDC